MSQSLVTANKTSPAPKIGRPSGYTPEADELICTSMMQGMSLRQCCKEHKLNMATVCRWLHSEPSFREHYDHARELQSEIMATDMLEISQNRERDILEGRGNAAAVNRDKLIVDTFKWNAARMQRDKYGDKQVIEHTVDDTLKGLLAGSNLRLGNTDAIDAEFEEVED